MVLPRIPVNSAITPSTQTAVTITMAAFALGALVYALYHWSRSGKPVFLMLFIAGGCMMAMEAAVDTVGACWFPRRHSWVVFTAYGRPIPLWLCLAYFFYFGILGGVFWTVMRRGIGPRGVWALFAAGIAGDAIFEITLLHFHTYIYYGGQPLRILRFPFWWAPVNSLIVVVVAGAVARFERQLSGRRALLIVPLAVSVSAAVNAVAGWPSWLVINSRMPWAPRQLGGLATYAVAAAVVSLVARALSPPARLQPIDSLQDILYGQAVRPTSEV
jgi:fumarate reductase subunit D